MILKRNMGTKKSNTSVSDLLLTEEVAKLLRCHCETIRRALRDGRLQGIKVGRGWRIDRSELIRTASQGGL
jgi:excisionase family DNA binding protein